MVDRILALAFRTFKRRMLEVQLLSWTALVLTLTRATSGIGPFVTEGAIVHHLARVASIRFPNGWCHWNGLSKHAIETTYKSLYNG